MLWRLLGWPRVIAVSGAVMTSSILARWLATLRSCPCWGWSHKTHILDGCLEVVAQMPVALADDKSCPDVRSGRELLALSLVTSLLRTVGAVFLGLASFLVRRTCRLLGLRHRRESHRTPGSGQASGPACPRPAPRPRSVGSSHAHSCLVSTDSETKF